MAVTVGKGFTIKEIPVVFEQDAELRPVTVKTVVVAGLRARLVLVEPLLQV
jgi:hypothetical protein